MNRQSQGIADEQNVHGLHVLAMLPPVKKERSRFLIQLLEAGKERWDWRVSVLCDGIEREDCRALVAPGGQAIERPHLLREMAWERDPAAVERVEETMREAERAAGLASGGVILAAGHSVGRGYNLPVRHMRKYALVRRVTRDSAEPFRIIRRLFQFADEMLDKAKPDLIYAFEWATPLNLCVWMAAQRRGIPCVAMRYSKIVPGHAFWTTDRGMMNTMAMELATKNRVSGAVTSAEAKEHLAAFRDRPRVISYIAERWSNQARRNFVRWHAQYARIIVREFFNSFRGQDSALREPPFSRLFRYYHFLYLGAAHQRFFRSFDEDALASMKYVYFPLHKEAELAQTFQAPLWYDQRKTVRVLASMLPQGYRLLVREHRLNLGHRPTRSFEEFATIPNVTLIDPYDSQFKYLRHADLIVTENGSSGWEGLVLGRRVLTLSRTFYDGAGLGTKILDPDKLNAAVLEKLNSEPVSDAAEWDHALGCVIDAERETTFPGSADGVRAALDLLKHAVGPLLPVRSQRDVAAA
jgi:hypothetical protein